MKRPSLTRKILNGLTEAFDRMEEDDLLDLTTDEQDEHEAAGLFIEQMGAYLNSIERKERRTR